jgi:thiol-disulfide isomerase/thioredoxin
LELHGERQVYAESILKVCEFCVGSPLACISGVSGADLKKRIVRIMTEHVARKLDFSRKLLLSAAGLVAVAMPVVFGLLHAAQSPAAPQAQAEAKSVGARPLAPQFTLTDISGQRLSLADYKGTVVMLDFWATWCGACRLEIPGFVELQNRYRDQGFAIIGISMDDGPEVVQEFYEQFKMNYPVALGDDNLSELYGGIFGMPTTLPDRPRRTHLCQARRSDGRRRV